MFGWLTKRMRPSLAIAGIVDAVLMRVSDWELRLYHGCDNGAPYLALRFAKRPPFIDLDGDGKPDA